MVQQQSQKEGLLHVEIQSEDDQRIVTRLLEYNLLATLTYEKPVLSWLILLRPMPEAPHSPLISALFDEMEVWRFSYAIMKVWEISADELLQTGLIGLLPLLPLTNGGTEPERLATTIATLYAADEYELLSLTKLLAGLVMKHKSQQDLLERLFAMYKDIVEESWVYQQIVQRGLEKGLEQGLEKGLEQGLEKGLEKGLGLGEQRALVAIIQRRFPDIVPTAKELIDGITDADTLEKLVGEVSVAQNAQDVLHILRTR